MRGEECSSGLACGFLLRFLQKFLEIRSQREAGGWEAQRSERLSEEKEKSKAHRLAFIKP
jgi:hypothetical protein